MKSYRYAGKRLAGLIRGCYTDKDGELPREQSQSYAVGYRAGAQHEQLLALGSRLDDNRELFKSHLLALRDSARNNHDSLRRLHGEYNKQITADIRDTHERVVAKFDALHQHLLASEDNLRELSRQHFETLERHFDERLENIKDTIKLGILLLIIINFLLLYMFNTYAMGRGSFK